MVGYKQTASRAGFTVVELIVVIIIIALLMVLAAVSYGVIVKSAADKSLLADLESMAAIETQYSLNNNGVAKAWYSGSGSDAQLKFLPSDDNVIDVVIKDDMYCIRAYSPRASKNTIQTAATKGSDENACLLMDASVAAGGSGGTIAGWYKLNGNANDSSGFGRNGTVSGATLTTGQDGQANGAYKFSDTVIQSINTNYNYPFDRITVSIWAKPTGLSPNSYPSIISNSRECCATYNGFHLYYSKTSPYAVTSRLWWGTTSSSGVAYNGLTLNSWQLITMTFNGTNQIIYRNGVQVAINSPPTTTLGASAFNVYIGKGGWMNGYSFGGDLDDARIYNYAMNANDVQALYQKGAQ